MFLSRVPLNINKKKTVTLLSSPRFIHGAVERGFEGPRNRNLWRVDTIGDVKYLSVLSPVEPDFSHIVHEYGYEEDLNGLQSWQTQDFSDFLSSLKDNQRWHFVLSANAVKSSATIMNNRSGRSKIVACRTEDEMRQWLLDRCEKHGFAVDGDLLKIRRTEWSEFVKRNAGGNVVSLNVVDYEGHLVITDAELFKEVLVNGLGRAKAYGCGMLKIS